MHAITHMLLKAYNTDRREKNVIYIIVQQASNPERQWSSYGRYLPYPKLYGSLDHLHQFSTYPQKKSPQIVGF
ncbi:hypothetical protein KSZ_67000 [Dictyobacter formicarum]|uniref:Uncharacterized protein n=1 Tax=Dictyobacter formicarum TaxID=2778368 RepID=A0ABQ3VQZ6_9CHLR|nr:hypothetical protein KSZ_67000 [Dictyobacter formicarum]